MIWDSFLLSQGVDQLLAMTGCKNKTLARLAGDNASANYLCPGYVKKPTKKSGKGKGPLKPTECEMQAMNALTARAQVVRAPLESWDSLGAPTRGFPSSVAALGAPIPFGPIVAAMKVVENSNANLFLSTDSADAVDGNSTIQMSELGENPEAAEWILAIACAAVLKYAEIRNGFLNMMGFLAPGEFRKLSTTGLIFS